MDDFRGPNHEEVLKRLVNEVHAGESDIFGSEDLLNLLLVYIGAKGGSEFTTVFDSWDEFHSVETENHPICTLSRELGMVYRVSLMFRDDRDAFGQLDIQYSASEEQLAVLDKLANLPIGVRRGRFFGYPLSALTGHCSYSSHSQMFDDSLPALVENGVVTPDEIAMHLTYNSFVPELNNTGVREAIDIAFDRRSRVRRFIETTGLTKAHEVLDDIEEQALREAEYLIQREY